jgi:hypothetical protein
MLKTILELAGASGLSLRLALWHLSLFDAGRADDMP